MPEQRIPTAHEVNDSEEVEPIITADGAVRQLEKSSIAEKAAPSRDAPAHPGEVTSLGKAGDGAPEEEAADASEVTDA